MKYRIALKSTDPSMTYFVIYAAHISQNMSACHANMLFGRMVNPAPQNVRKTFCINMETLDSYAIRAKCVAHTFRTYNIAAKTQYFIQNLAILHVASEASIKCQRSHSKAIKYYVFAMTFLMLHSGFAMAYLMLCNGFVMV